MGAKFKKSYKKFLESPELYERDTLFLIIDTNVAGRRFLNATADLIKAKEESVYKNIKVIAPIQITTEITSILFEHHIHRVLSDELHKGPLHEFYREFKDDIKFVDTPVSDYYKGFFANRAFQLIGDDKYLIKDICKSSAGFSEKYFPEKKKTKNFQVLQNKYFEFKDDYTKALKSAGIKFDKNEKNVKHSFSTNDFSELKTHLGLKTDNEIKLAEFASNYFKNCPESYRILLQGMYANEEMKEKLSVDPAFSAIRADKGEQGAVSYLLKNHLNQDPKIVVAFLSNDVGARNIVKAVRHETQNTIFVLGDYPYAKALKEIGVVENILQVISAFSIDNYAKKVKSFRKKISEDKDSKKNDINPFQEEKWAMRFVEIWKYGRFEDRYIDNSKTFYR